MLCESTHLHTNNSIVEVGIALDDMTVENGALMVIPGSPHQRYPEY
jgi:ectoine hydroxylase-related dioxygenase (phytanoyl-CoA dioxygenase family)